MYNRPVISNSQMKPSSVAAGMQNNTFARWHSTYEPTITNCYYVETANLPTNQGTQAFALATAPANIGSLTADYGMVKAYANGILFDGTNKSTMFSAEDKSTLLMGGGNTLYHPTTGAGIGAQRAYFKIGDDGAQAKLITAFSIDFGEDETTGIISIENGQLTIRGTRLTVAGSRASLPRVEYTSITAKK